MDSSDQDAAHQQGGLRRKYVEQSAATGPLSSRVLGAFMTEEDRQLFM